jgi:hypothetical protein
MTDPVPPGRAMNDDLRARMVAAVGDVQALPYAWPADPSAAAARASGSGSCASKHALLAEELDGLGLDSLPLLVVGPLLPPTLADDPAFADAAGLLEVHECLTVVTPWAGPVRVDVTWDPPLVHAGLDGSLDWDGRSDMVVAVRGDGPGWSVPRNGLRAAKEGLRSRLYRSDERARRDRILAAVVARFEAWRREDRIDEP